MTWESSIEDTAAGKRLASQLTGLPLLHSAMPPRRLSNKPAELTADHAKGLAEMPGTSQGFTGRDLGESDVTSMS